MAKTKTEVKRRARTPDRTAELFPNFAAGIARAKRVRVVLRKLAGWPPADIAALVEALRERADTACGDRKIEPTFSPSDTVHLNVKSSTFRGLDRIDVACHPAPTTPGRATVRDATAEWASGSAEAESPFPPIPYDNAGESVGQPLE